MKYAVVDIETTGAQSSKDKITEIAILLTDGKKILEEYSTLINPETSIPPFISGLTGIYDDMVADAPKFYEVAKKIQLMTEDAIFVAHNVRFDYGFLKKEFAELGGTFVRKNLCTVRLARKVIPGYKSYSLGKLCAEIGIEIQDRHRAMGDAKATTILLHKLIAEDEKGHVQKLINDEVGSRAYPPQFDPKKIEALPEEPGVYHFFDGEGKLLYIGKSLNIKKRVLDHFQIDTKSAKEFKFKSSIADVTFETTGSELMALLLEADLIKEERPHFNQALRRKYYRYGLFVEKEEGVTFFRVSSLHNHGVPLKEFGTRRAGLKYLDKICEKYEIYSAYTDLDADDLPASGDDPLHEVKAKTVCKDLSYPHHSFVIWGPGRTPEERSAILVEEGCLTHRGYVLEGDSVSHVSDLKMHLTQIEENRDNKQILLQFFKKKALQKGHRVIKDKRFFQKETYEMF